MNKKKIFVDFDGVIHSYSSKWRHIALIPDPPVTGAIEWLSSLITDGRFSVSLFTARNATDAGVEATKKWLREYGVDIEKIKFVGNKPHFHVFIDDRVLGFEGTFPELDMLATFKPWSKRDSLPNKSNLSQKANELLQNESVMKETHITIKKLLEEISNSKF